VTAIGAVLGWIISRSALPGRRLLDFPLGDVGRHSAGHRRPCRDGAVPVAADRRLRHGRNTDPRLFVLALPRPRRLARAGFLQSPPELEEASAASGARFLTTQRRVLLPLILPALTAGFILLFIIGVREFTLPLVLYSQENVVLSGAAVAAVPERPAGAFGGARHPSSSSWCCR
jgi:iron(III) transport system permease protein